MTIINEEKKILIVSKSDDIASKHIKEWLLATDVSFVSLDYDKARFRITKLNAVDSSFCFMIGDTEHDIRSFHTIYFHKGALQLGDYTGMTETIENIKNFDTAFRYYRMAYETSIKEIVDFAVHGFNTIGRDNGGRINKLKMLHIAAKAGMRIPNTAVTTKKEELRNFFAANSGEIITKCLDINMIFQDTEARKLVHALTSSIAQEDLESLPDVFPLSVFQQNIPKVLELRIFFVGEENYASAIFSQMSENTKQDYRNYDMDIPSRVVPYELPSDITHKLNVFKKLTNLRTGSFDLILTPDNEYVFLEVNPQGQFLGVSDYCNYYLERKLVNYLIA